MGAEIVLPTGGFEWKGEWDPDTDYHEGDVVKRDGNTYRAFSETNAGDDPLNGGVWEIFLPKGQDGDEGLAGDQGPIGPDGPKGDKGDRGDVGPVGPDGPKGDKGDQGNVGAASVVPGPEGPEGPAGPDGPPGADSVVPGPQGEPGAPGLKGDKGDQGDPGAPGADSIVPGPAGPPGNDSVVPGPEGPPGADGADGVDGAPGADGAVGPEGPEGPQGDPGPAGGSEIASAALQVNYAVTNAFADVPGWQIVVPANSGPCDLRIDTLTLNIATGTNAAAVLLMLEIQILDELDAQIAYGKWSVLQVSNVSKNLGGTIPISQPIGNFGIAKTYRVRAKMNLAATNAAASNIFTDDSGFPNPWLRAIRR